MASDAPAGVHELQLLAVAAFLGLVHMVLQGATARRLQGFKWAAGSRDEPRPVSGLAARMDRAFANYRETFPIFAAAIIAAYLLGRMGTLTFWGAHLYVIGRLIYIPFYIWTIGSLRSLVWGVSMVGIILVLLAFVL